MLQVLKKYFGYDSFRPKQEDVIKAILNNEDVLLLMPTGGGKSLCFQVPALLREGLCLVVSPLIALMKDQVSGLQANGVAAEFLNSSLNSSQEEEIIQRCVDGKVKLLYISPEKAVKLSEGFYTSLRISLIAIDEAHCISGWGHDFRPEYTQLKLLRNLIPGVPVIALTATADKITRRDIISQLQLKSPKVFVASFDRPNLSLKVMSNARDKYRVNEIVLLAEKYPTESGIVYCLSRAGTERMTENLQAAGVSAGCYHAGLSSEERTRVQEGFIKDEIQVICATIAFGMGIDKSNVRFVVHNNLPKNIESYYQEIGRAGRDGLPSETILFYSLGDLRMLREFAGNSGRKEFNLEKLQLMQEYADARICRRKILLNYFSEQISESCGNCDVCKNPPRFIDGTILAQKALSAIMRMDQKAAAQMVINVLRGSHQADVIEKGYDKIKTFGSGADLSFDAWRAYMMQFIQNGLVEIAFDENSALHVTSFGKEVLHGRHLVHLVKFDPYLTVKIKKTALSTVSNNRNEPLTLFDILRNVRYDLSKKEGIPPFVIFTDNTLRLMERFQPVTGEAFVQIPGVSEKKLEKYGRLFMDEIKKYCGPGPEIPVVTPPAFTNEKIGKMVEEMKRAGSRQSHAHLADILLANPKSEFTNEELRLPFFGSLKNMTTIKALRAQLKNYFTEFIDKIENQKTESFFAPPSYNRLGEEKGKHIWKTIGNMPMNRPTESITNGYILEQRRQFARAYEPWSEEEEKLFLEAIEFTNDLNFLSSIFKRNPSSLKQVFKKLVAGTVESLETS